MFQLTTNVVILTLKGGRTLNRLVFASIFAVGMLVSCYQTDRATETILIGKAVVPPTVDIPTGSPSATIRISPRLPIPREGFVPLDNPSVIASDNAEHLADDELVLGIEWASKVRAYPLRMLRYHHIVNDTVDGKPLLITY